MTQNSQNPQYPNENRKKRNKINLIFAICVISAVAIAAASILVAMALVGKAPAPETPETPPAVSSGNPASSASETGSMTVSSSEASSTTGDLSSAIQLEGTKDAIVQSDDRLLAIVNNTTPLPDSFKANLTNAFDAKIDKSMVEDFEALYSAGEKKEHYYWITYSYRSEKDQDKVYNDRVKDLVASGMTKAEAQKEADKTVQKGGASEYMTGLSIGVNTVDDDFAKTEEYKWLVENGPKYGFVLRYPKDKEEITGVEYQPWRFRYVGRTHAKKMQELNMCLEEYVLYLNGQSDAASGDSASQS